MSIAPAPENTQQQLPSLTPEKLTQMLDSLGISYEIHHHAPIYTVAEGEHLKKSIPGVHCRNLFLVDKKKRMMLLVLANETAIDLKKLPALLNSDRLSFGSAERLWQYLEITPGSVNPFCIANDKDHAVDLFLDQHMMAADIVNYHPMDNAQTISLKPSDLLKYLEKLRRRYTLIDLATARPEEG
jgi:Ala-tRNA(Pro) deacylase